MAKIPAITGKRWLEKGLSIKLAKVYQTYNLYQQLRLVEITNQQKVKPCTPPKSKANDNLS